MKKINYSDLVKNFRSISISINTIIESCLYTDFVVIRNLIQNSDGSLERLIYFHENISFNDISSIIVRKDGLYCNLDKILSKICNIYGIKDFDAIEIEDTINKLMSLKTVEDVENFSVRLFNKYRESSKYINKNYVKCMIRKNNNENNRRRSIEERKLKNEFKKKTGENSIQEYQSRLNIIYDIYPIFDIEKRADEIIVEQFIKESVDNLKELLKYSKDEFHTLAKVSDEILEYIDFEKLGFMLAITVKESAEKNIENTNLYKNALIYLRKYIKENEHLVKQNYTVLKKHYNTLGVLDVKKYEISSIIDFINSSISTCDTKQVNTSISSDVEKYDHSFLEYQSYQQSREVLGKYLKIGIKQENDDYSKKILDDKMKFYEEFGYEKICIGLNSFDGYVGFCLDNGVVILDKMYDNVKIGKIAVDQAVYITTIDEFDKVTKLTKTECIDKISKKELNVKRVIHSEGWQERVTRTCNEFVKK